MYFVMESDAELASKFIYFRDDPKDFDMRLLRDGRPLQDLPTAIWSADNPRALPFSDLALGQADLLVMSPRLRGVMASAGASNIEYFPVSLVDRTGGRTVSDYMIANVLGSIACLDVANSVTKIMVGFEGQDPPRYRVVKQFALDEDKIRASDVSNGDPRIFRLKEFRYHVIVDESLKAAVEDAGITGVKFTPTHDVS